MTKVNQKNQIEDFALEESEINIIYADGNEQKVDRVDFENWLIESNYLRLNHGRTANNYRNIGLDVDGFYYSPDRVITALTNFSSLNFAQ